MTHVVRNEKNSSGIGNIHFIFNRDSGNAIESQFNDCFGEPVWKVIFSMKPHHKLIFSILEGIITILIFTRYGIKAAIIRSFKYILKNKGHP